MKQSIKKIFFLTKIILALGLSILAYEEIKSKKYLLIWLIELGIIITLTVLIYKKSKIASDIFNDICFILFNSQLIIMKFGMSYLSWIMVSNIDSLKALTGSNQFVWGVIAFAVMVIICLLPIESIAIPRIKWDIKNCLILLLCLELVLTLYIGNEYSPFYAYIQLFQEQVEHNDMLNVDGVNDEDEIIEKIYKEEIYNYRDKDEQLPEKPNVILVFTEGLSKHVIEDDRNITPNLQEFSTKCISFDNYYNHTAATYRGIIGQLYSGYQLDNYDKNELISIQSIFHENGYFTEFINAEPANKEFTQYLSNMNFDELHSEISDQYNGAVEDTMSDKDMYNELFETARELSENDEPFFLTAYTFGTHVYYDSPDEKFGDGTNTVLNRFYNMDYQFGEFLEKFNDSCLSDNTIIIFTADHGTYCDQEYIETFPQYQRNASFCDEIPLMIYYNGITPQIIESSGVNSLDLPPTICDYLDISESNYFLGESLFRLNKEYNEYDTVYFDGTSYYTTENGIVSEITGDKLTEIKNKLKEYFSLSR